jgi:hypothetical protein
VTWAPSAPGLSARRPSVPFIAVLVACSGVAYVLGASGALAGVPLLAAFGGAVGLVALMVCAMRFPGWIPAVLLAAAALVPYQVSVVGKTPFGVVSAVGVLSTVALLALFVSHLRGRSRLVLHGPETRAMALWSALLVLAAMTSDDPRLSLNIARTIIVGLPLAYLAGRLIRQVDPDAPRRVVMVVTLLAALATVEEVSSFTPYAYFPQEGFPLVPPPPAIRDGLERVRLGFYHGSTLGTVLAVALPLVVLHTKLGMRRRPWMLAVVVLGIFCTITFQVWVAALVVAALLGLGLRYLRLSLALGIVAGALVIGSGAVSPLNQLIENRLHPTGSHADEYAFRLQLWPAAVEAASDGPLLGEGPGMFNQLGLTGTVRGTTVLLVNDNTFASKIVETGYLGTFVLCLVLALVIRRMWQHGESWRRWAGLAAVAAWCTMAMSVELLVSDQALLPTWMIIGMLSVDPGREVES